MDIALLYLWEEKGSGPQAEHQENHEHDIGAPNMASVSFLC